MVQGEDSHDAVLILAGQVRVIADSARGAIPIATLEAPCLVGELGALAHLQRSATVRARTPVSVLRVGRSALADVARTTPSLLIDVIGRMGDRLRRFNDAIGLYTHALEALETARVRPGPARGAAQSAPRPRGLRPYLRADGRAAPAEKAAERRDGERGGHPAGSPAQARGIRSRHGHRRLRLDECGARRGRRLVRACGARRRTRGRRRRRCLRQGRPGRPVHRHHQDFDPHQPAREAGPARSDPEGQRLSRQQQRR